MLYNLFVAFFVIVNIKVIYLHAKYFLALSDYNIICSDYGLESRQSILMNYCCTYFAAYCFWLCLMLSLHSNGNHFCIHGYRLWKPLCFASAKKPPAFSFLFKWQHWSAQPRTSCSLNPKPVIYPWTSFFPLDSITQPICHSSGLDWRLAFALKNN